MAHIPAVAQCPDPIDTTNLHFKSLSKVQLFNTDGTTFDLNTNLVAVSNNSGLTFIGTLNGFLILKSKYVFSGGNNIDQYQKEIILNSRTTHLATAFDDNHLAVACQTKMGPIIYIYNIQSFLTKGVAPIKTVPLSKPFQVSQLCEMLWQPNTENGLTVSFLDGSVSSLSFFQGSGNDIFSLPHTTGARCLCWSPKGKQIVIGSSDGSLSQYKPDLKFVKKLSSPPLFNGAVAVVNVLWLSNFQFLAAYKDANKSDAFPVIVIVNAPKNEPIRFINYDDLTYSSVLYRPHQFYFSHVIPWNLIFIASANSIEVAVLHAKEDNSTWEQWLLGDASRAELPLNSNKSETFPLGLAFDYTSDQVVPWGEETLPPMPRLLMLSSEGLLITFNVINTTRNASQICSGNRNIFDDSWFSVVEKTSEINRTEKTNESIENFSSQSETLELAKSSQGFPSTFTSLTSVSLTPQENVTAAAGTLNMKMQPQKQQALPQIQQQTQSQLLQSQVQIQSGTASVFQNPNSLSKWPQKTSFSFSLSPNTGSAGESGQVAVGKPNDIFKNVEQNANFFTTKPSIAQVTQPTETKDNSSLEKPQKSPESPIEARRSVSGISPSPAQFMSTPVGADTKSNRKRTPESSPSRGTPDIATVDYSVYVTALWDEVDHFNAELEEVISRISAVTVGTEGEKENFRNCIEKLKNFENGLNETTASQKKEIHAIQSDVMEAFAWLEDARSRNRQRKSPTFIELKKSQDLDPICSRLTTEVHRLQYYIENQLKQLHSYLMKEWMEHQDSCRLDFKTSMAIPSMEELYKTMHLELKILSKQRAIVEELSKRLKERNLKNRGDIGVVTSSVRNHHQGVDNTRMSELFKLADNLLQIKIDRDEHLCVTDAFQMMMKKQINAVAERRRKFTAEKQNVLRDILTEREMLKTRSVKSTFTSSSFIRNASSRIYSKALLTSKWKETEKDGNIGAENVQISILDSPTDGISSTSDKSGNGPKFALKEIDSSALGQNRQDNALVSSKSNVQKPAELFKFSVPKSTFVPQFNDKVGGKSESSEQKATPFVFKASPVLTAAAGSSISVEKSMPGTVTIGHDSHPENASAETVVTCSPGNSADAFLFKFSDSASTVAVTQTFSFTANRTSSSFYPRTDVNFSELLVGVRPTSASDGPAQNPTFAVYSSSSNVANLPVTSSFNTIFGNSGILSPFSGSVSKNNSGNSIFSSTPSTDALSVAAVAPMARPKSGTASPSNITSPGKSAVILPSSSTTEVETTVATSAESLGRSISKATTVVFATTTTNAPPTTTTATIGSDITTSSIATVPFSSSAPTVVSTSLVPGGVVTDAAESEIPDGSKQEAQESEKSEEVKSAVAETHLSGALTPSPALLIKTEAESSETQAVATVSSVFVTATQPGFFTVPVSTVQLGIQASNSGNIFEQGISAGTTAANIFSTPTTNIFSPTKAVTTSPTLFGSSAAVTSTSCIFGQPAVTTVTSANIFGQVTPTTTATAFGQQQKDEIGQTAKLFGDVLGSSLSSRNIFDTPTSTTTSGNIFGKSSFEKAGGSIFGNASVVTTATTTATAASGSSSQGIFGSSTSNIFSKSLVPQTQLPTSTTSSIFGQPQNTDSGNTFFGQNICNTFGGGISSSSNQNPFGNTTGFNSKPVFGQSLFGQSSTGQNPFERSQSSSIFGGSPATTQNVFQSGSSSFGCLPPGPFSGGQSTAGQTGIGGGSAFQKPMGGNIFGSSPSFTRSGTTPTFGGAPTFGSPATFGSPQKVFGSSQGTFGQNQANAPTFGALANQTDGFANLALQSQNQAPPFGGNTFTQNSNFGGESNFGGTSFSSWRS